MKSAKSAQELFLQANQAYTRKEYEKAFKLYDQIPHKKPVVWYNMGNCAYKKNDDLHALLYWKRAEQSSSGSLAHDSSANCAVVLKKLSLTPEAKMVGCVLLWQILFFCAFSVFLISSLYVIRKKKYLLFFACSTVIAALGIQTYYMYAHMRYRRALVMNNEAIVYAGPHTEYHQLATIPAGLQVIVQTHKNSWAKIAWQKKSGWVPDSSIEII